MDSSAPLTTNQTPELARLYAGTRSNEGSIKAGFTFEGMIDFKHPDGSYKIIPNINYSFDGVKSVCSEPDPDRKWVFPDADTGAYYGVECDVEQRGGLLVAVIRRWWRVNPPKLGG